MPKNTKSKTSKINSASNPAPKQSPALTAEPFGLEKIIMDRFIERIGNTPSSKVNLCIITATYARNGWEFPKRLREWTAKVMESASEGKKPFAMPRGKHIPTFDIVVFVKTLQKKGYDLSQAKKRAMNKFNVGGPTINKALRRLDINDDVLKYLEK